jgi:uncharacterized protein (DUF1330 family)
MAAYVIADLEVTDPARFAEYRQQVPATVAAYGGRFLVPGGEHEVVEGDWRPRRLVVLEFPSLAQAPVVRVRGVPGTEGDPAGGREHERHLRGGRVAWR